MGFDRVGLGGVGDGKAEYGKIEEGQSMVGVRVRGWLGKE